MKKCKMCTYIYDDSMGFCPECGALDFEPVARPAEKKPEPAVKAEAPAANGYVWGDPRSASESAKASQSKQTTPAANSYTWGDPRSTSAYNPESKTFEPVKVQEKKPSSTASQPSRNTTPNSNGGSCLGTLFKWAVYFFAFFIVIYIITEVL